MSNTQIRNLMRENGSVVDQESVEAFADPDAEEYLSVQIPGADSEPEEMRLSNAEDKVGESEDLDAGPDADEYGKSASVEVYWSGEEDRSGE